LSGCSAEEIGGRGQQKSRCFTASAILTVLTAFSMKNQLNLLTFEA
jgi:hypothetical protein